jgi:hypothetical protein
VDKPYGSNQAPPPSPFVGDKIMLGPEHTTLDEQDQTIQEDHPSLHGAVTRPAGLSTSTALKPRAKPVLPSANRRSSVVPRDASVTQPGQLSFSFKFRTD